LRAAGQCAIRDGAGAAGRPMMRGAESSVFIAGLSIFQYNASRQRAAPHRGGVQAIV